MSNLQEIEDIINNLSQSLSTLPENLKTKALEILEKQLHIKTIKDEIKEENDNNLNTQIQPTKRLGKKILSLKSDIRDETRIKIENEVFNDNLNCSNLSESETHAIVEQVHQIDYLNNDKVKQKIANFNAKRLTRNNVKRKLINNIESSSDPLIFEKRFSNRVKLKKVEVAKLSNPAVKSELINEENIGDSYNGNCYKYKKIKSLLEDSNNINSEVHNENQILEYEENRLANSIKEEFDEINDKNYNLKKKRNSKLMHKDQRIECQICKKILASKFNFSEHMRRHTGEALICDVCGQKFVTKSGLTYHRRCHFTQQNSLQCTKCKFVGADEQLLEEHFALKHSRNRPRNHICHSCGKAFFNAQQLENHYFSHSMEKDLACSMCNFTTAYPGSLKQHYKNVHCIEKAAYKCELCGIDLKFKRSYKDHLKRHFDRREKECNICGKAFLNNTQLMAHKRTHEAPSWPCSMCEKQLKSKQKLLIHMLIHKGQKDFKCPICHYSTCVKHNLKKHCWSIHNLVYPPNTEPRMLKRLVFLFCNNNS